MGELFDDDAATLVDNVVADDDDVGCCDLNDADDADGGIDGELEIFRFDADVVSVNKLDTATDCCPLPFDDPVGMIIADVVVGSNFIDDDDELILLILLLLLLLLLLFVDDDDDN